MARFIIPVQPTTDPFSQQVELDGLIYDLTFLWNARDVHWSLTVGREDVVLIDEVKLVIIDDLLAQYRRIEDLPPGIFSVIDLDGLDRDPDDTLFGDRVLLIYEEAN
jgi:hypothetical protein